MHVCSGWFYLYLKHPVNLQIGIAKTEKSLRPRYILSTPLTLHTQHIPHTHTHHTLHTNTQHTLHTHTNKNKHTIYIPTNTQHFALACSHLYLRIQVHLNLLFAYGEEISHNFFDFCGSLEVDWATGRKAELIRLTLTVFSLKLVLRTCVPITHIHRSMPNTALKNFSLG